MTERWPSGRRRTPAKGVRVKSPSRVRIPLSPPVRFGKSATYRIEADPAPHTVPHKTRTRTGLRVQGECFYSSKPVTILSELCDRCGTTLPRRRRQCRTRAGKTCPYCAALPAARCGGFRVSSLTAGTHAVSNRKHRYVGPQFHSVAFGRAYEDVINLTIAAPTVATTVAMASLGADYLLTFEGTSLCYSPDRNRKQIHFYTNAVDLQSRRQIAIPVWCSPCPDHDRHSKYASSVRRCSRGMTDDC